MMRHKSDAIRRDMDAMVYGIMKDNLISRNAMNKIDAYLMSNSFVEYQRILDTEMQVEEDMRQCSTLR